MANSRNIWVLLFVLIYLVLFIIWYTCNGSIELSLHLPLVDETLSSNIPQVDLLFSSDHQSLPIIMFWTKFFGINYPLEQVSTNGLMQCGDMDCYITNDKRYLKNSSAVIFHGRASDFLSGITKVKSFPRPTKQVLVYMNQESPLHTHIKVPDNVFNWSMTYKLDSDVYTPYGEVSSGVQNDGFDPTKNYLTGRTKFAFVVVSNCVNYRMKLYNKLKEHFDLEILGGCGKPCGRKCFSNVTQYKFYLAFENSLCTDYLTEKTYSQLQRGIVPVVLSGANLSNPRVVPPGSVIDANKFSTAAELAEYLKKVGNDPLLYNKFYEWRNHWKITLSPFCPLCEKLHKHPIIKKTLPNGMSWFSKSDCKTFQKWG
jgi:hypothetical protein